MIIDKDNLLFTHIDLAAPGSEGGTSCVVDGFYLNLPYLGKMLFDDWEKIIRLIDEDDELSHRSPELGPNKALVIANAQKSLFTPKEFHQLYAKGIVYLRDPYRLVSLPYIKMYNYSVRPDASALANCYSEREDIAMSFSEKMDGTLIQAFSTAGRGIPGPDRVSSTLRSVLKMENSKAMTRSPRRFPINPSPSPRTKEVER